MTTSAPTVLVAAAPTLYREGLVALLRAQWPHLQLSLTADATQLPPLVGRRPYGVLILDGLLPGLGRAPLLARLHHARPAQRQLLLAGPASPPAAPAAWPWPEARRRVPRHAPPGTILTALAPWLDALWAETTGAAWCAAGEAADYFSPRELQVLSLVVADCCNQEIADELCLSVRTVESHRRTLLRKAGTKTLVGLTARALREGWVA